MPPLKAALKQEQSYKGMGTTLTGSYSFGDDLFIFHIGDSRAYLYRNEKLSQLTNDHTLAQELADRGDISSRKQFEKHRLKHILTRSIGHSAGKPDVEIHQLKLQNNDLVLICSDGLHDMISDQQIMESINSRDSAQDKCQVLQIYH